MGKQARMITEQPARKRHRFTHAITLATLDRLSAFATAEQGLFLGSSS
jgi:hypothetical protein